MDEWQTAAPVWQKFCAEFPQLGLEGSRWSWVHFHRTYGKKMRELGVMRRASTGRYLLNAQTFPQAAFELLTTMR